MRKSLLRLPILAAMALSCAWTPAIAQQQTQQQAQRPQVVTQFDDLMVRYLLADVQATYQIARAPDGSTVYRANAEGQINFTVSPQSCTPEGVCNGLMLVAVFTDLPVNDPIRLDRFVNQFNDTNPTAKLLRSPEGMVVLQAYINAAFGISYRNAQAQLFLFGENIAATSRALAAMERN